MTRTIGAAAGRVHRAHPVHRPDDGARIDEQGPGFIGFVEPPPPYQAGPRRKLPGWAKHLRDLRPLTLAE